MLLGKKFGSFDGGFSGKSDLFVSPSWYKTWLQHIVISSSHWDSPLVEPTPQRFSSLTFDRDKIENEILADQTSIKNT